MKTIFRWLPIYCLGLFVLSSCETTDLDITEDPNALGPDQASTDLFINSVQRDFGNFVANVENAASEAVRILQFNDGTYLQHFGGPTAFDTQWQDAYQGILQDLRTMGPLAREDADEDGLPDQPYHIGMGQVMEAYTITALVDLFGDVPYREALQGAENFNPETTPGADIYSDALDLLDSAIANFEREDVSSQPAIDLFYGGNWKYWVKAANSLKLKLLITTRLVDSNAASEFASIIDEGEFITKNSEDFQFPWGNSVNNPDSRHPRYALHYTPSGVATGYMSNWLMDYMLNNKRGNGNVTFEGADPRIKYYFFRQSAAISTNVNDIMCIAEAAAPHGQTDPIFCTIPNNGGYWGRAHGNNRGIPPDTQQRTAYGVYPVGGLFDDNSFKTIVSISMGGGGAGITPIMLASWVDFMRAEMALIGGPGDAGALVQSGVSKHIEKVRTFGSLDASADLSTAPDPADDPLFVQEIGELFNAADDDGKMDILGSEFFVSLFGNGLDGYNFYRRTGRPSNLQIHFIGNEGDFFRSFQYPSFFVTRNSSTDQKPDVTTRVFWDNGVTLLAN